MNLAKYASISITLAWILCIGCTAEGAGDCAINESQVCACSATESGVQVCQADQSFEPCDCTGTTEADAGTEDAATLTDECSDQTHNCDLNSSCVDLESGFLCECIEGYMDDGTSCVADEATMVADLAPFTAHLEIEGLGAFSIAGLSRVGVEIGVVEIPVTANRVQRSPGAIVFDDVTIRGLRGDVASLAIWADAVVSGTSDPRGALLVLDGLSGEQFILELFEVRAIAADTSVTDGALAEVVLRYDSMALIGAQQPLPAAPQPLPGTKIEIDGIGSNSVTPGAISVAGDILHPQGGDLTPLLEWRNAGSEGLAMLQWMLDTISDIRVSPATLTRRVMSVIEVDPSGTETGRIDIFEVWPYRLNVFNPTRPYRGSFLMDVFIAFDYTGG